MPSTLSTGLQNGLAVYYLICAVLNLGFAAYYHCVAQPRKTNIAAIWYSVAGLFLLLALAYFLGAGWVMPQGIRDAVDWFTGPISYTVLSISAFAALLYWRKFFVQPQVAWAGLNISLLRRGGRSPIRTSAALWPRKTTSRSRC
jgi:hypothetical protein